MHHVLAPAARRRSSRPSTKCRLSSRFGRGSRSHFVDGQLMFEREAGKVAGCP
jgi:hypothetical protein